MSASKGAYGQHAPLPLPQSNDAFQILRLFHASQYHGQGSKNEATLGEATSHVSGMRTVAVRWKNPSAAYAPIRLPMGSGSCEQTKGALGRQPLEVRWYYSAFFRWPCSKCEHSSQLLYLRLQDALRILD
jgi:hypothetical protein